MAARLSALASKANPFNKKKSSHTFKVAFLGDAGVVGFDYYTKEVVLEDTRVTLQIWDTAGMEQFRSALVTNYYRDTDGVVFVYDMIDRESFSSVEETWLRELKQYRGLENVQMALVGNKGDRGSKRKVASQEGRALAEKYGMLFEELSAAEKGSYDKLTSLMKTLCTNIVRHQMEETGTSSVRTGEVITLGTVPIADDWQEIGTPTEPIPTGLFARQDVMARRLKNVVIARTNHNC
ncbi:hypothetical protein EMCRGX_G033659 [Ephydatia muelleri]